MESLELEEKEEKPEKKEFQKTFEELLNEVDFDNNYNYDDISLSLISDILIEIKRMLSKKHNQLLSASRISRDLNDLLLLLSDTKCTNEDFKNVKISFLKLHSFLVSYLDNRNDSDLEKMIEVLLQLKDKNKILVDNTKELDNTPAGENLLGYFGRNAELLNVQAKTNQLVRTVIAKEIKEKYPSLDLYDYTELDEAYKKLYNAIKNDDTEGITNTRGELIKKLKKYNSNIKKHAQELKTIIEIYKVIDINSIDLNTKISRIKEIVKNEKNPEIRKMIEDNLDNYRVFKKEFYELYNLLEVKKTELYENALKEELKAHGEFLKRRYNNEVLSKRFSITQTIPKGIAFSIKKFANAVDRIKYNEYSRKRKTLLKEAVIDATRIVSVPGVTALKFGVENWYTIYLVSNGLINISNERNDAAKSYKELNPDISDEDALKHVDEEVKNTPYRQQTLENQNKIRILALDRENAINSYMRTHAGVTREQAEETVDKNRETTPYDQQATNYETEYNTNRTNSEANDKERAIRAYMDAFGVSEEEATAAVEENSSRAPYDIQARTYEDAARNNAQTDNTNSDPAPETPQDNTNQNPQANQDNSEPVVGTPQEDEQQDQIIDEKNEILDEIDDALGNSTTLENKETGEKLVLIHADDGKIYKMRFDKDNNPIDETPVPLDNIDELRNDDNYVIADEVMDVYDLPDVSNETMIKNLAIGSRIVYTYGEDNNQTVNITRLGEDKFFVETIDNSTGEVVNEETISITDNPDYFAEFDEEFNSEVGNLYTFQGMDDDQDYSNQVTNSGGEYNQSPDETPDEEERTQNAPTPVYDANLAHLNYEAARTKAMDQLSNMASGDVVVVDYFENEETHTMIVYKIEDSYYVLDAKNIVDVDKLYEQELANCAPGNIPYRQTWENANSPDRLRDKFMRLDSLEDLHGCTLSEEEVRIPSAPTSLYLGELKEGETATFKRDDDTYVTYKVGKDGRIYYSEFEEGETPVNPALVLDNTYADDDKISYQYSNQEDMSIPMDDLVDLFNSLKPGQSITLGFVEDIGNAPLTVVSRSHDGKFTLYTHYGEDNQESKSYETAPELAKDGLDKLIPDVLTDQYGNMPNGIGQYVDIPIWIRPDFYNAAPVVNLRVVLYNGQIVGVKPMDPMNESALDLIMNGENPIQVGFK